MRAVLRLAVLAVPMGVLLSRTMAWMSSGKTHAELINRLRGKNTRNPALIPLFKQRVGSDELGHHLCHNLCPPLTLYLLKGRQHQLLT